MLTEDINLPPKGLGLPRIDMPQIISTDVNDFLKFLSNRRISSRKLKIPVSRLKLTQLEINKDKVSKMMGVASSNLAKVVLVSKDWFILDGHHRIVALYNKDPSFRVDIIQIDLNITSLLKVAKEYPKTMYKTVNEGFGQFAKKQLNEVLITFNKQAYPKFNQVVILAGGAGSGKGFIKNKLLGIEGKSIDVDVLKELALKSDLLASRIKKETGKDITKFNLKNSDEVSQLHSIISQYKIDSMVKSSLFSSVAIANPERKPNLIFDVTLKDISKLHKLSGDVIKLGYEKKNIHIVWVLNKFEVAAQQNKTRSRSVSDEIMLSTHEGAALTMKKILDMGRDLNKYLDGDIHVAWNQTKIDNEIIGTKGKGMFINRSDYMTVKQAGRPQIPTNKLSKEIVDKIKEYTPKIDIW